MCLIPRYPGIHGLSTMSAMGTLSSVSRLAARLKMSHCSGLMSPHATGREPVRKQHYIRYGRSRLRLRYAERSEFRARGDHGADGSQKRSNEQTEKTKQDILFKNRTFRIFVPFVGSVAPFETVLRLLTSAHLP